jgi:hypothetical protein
MQQFINETLTAIVGVRDSLECITQKQDVAVKLLMVNGVGSIKVETFFGTGFRDGKSGKN